MRRVVIPGAGHFFEGQLEEVASEVRAFLESLALSADAERTASMRDAEGKAS